MRYFILCNELLCFLHMYISVYHKVGNRYDGQIAVFGVDFQKKLEALKYFIVSLIFVCMYTSELNNKISLL